MGVELVELPGGHPQLQDRKLAPGPDRGRGVAGGYSRARTCCPGPALRPALSLPSTSPAELSSGNRLAAEADHGQPAIASPGAESGRSHDVAQEAQNGMICAFSPAGLE